jgi:hypothetical protein
MKNFQLCLIISIFAFYIILCGTADSIADTASKIDSNSPAIDPSNQIDDALKISRGCRYFLWICKDDIRRSCQKNGRL